MISYKERVWHEGLLFKLKCNGICGNLLNYFGNYLSNRYQRVVLNGKESNWMCLKAGVPQGSVLGPLLFLVCITDLTDNISSDMLRNPHFNLLINLFLISSNLLGTLFLEYVTFGIRLLTKIRVEFSDLCDHRFNHTFNCESPICACGIGTETSVHFFPMLPALSNATCYSS